MAVYIKESITELSFFIDRSLLNNLSVLWFSMVFLVICPLRMSCR